jgi:hypothetical protein
MDVSGLATSTFTGPNNQGLQLGLKIGTINNVFNVTTDA